MDPLKDALTRPDGIAARLLAMREGAGLMAKDLAASSGWHPSKVSRIESGRRRPSAEDVRQWASACGADQAATDAVLALLVEAQLEHRAWRLSERAGQSAIQEKFNEITANSTDYSELALTVIPGILQTADVARFIATQSRKRHGGQVDDDEATVQKKLRRQQLLFESGRTFRFILDEGVLRRLVVPADLMRGQLDRLQTLIGAPHVGFAILPFGVPLSTTPLIQFSLYRGAETLVSAETEFGPITYYDADVAAFISTFDQLWADSATGDDARQLIITAQRALPLD